MVASPRQTPFQIWTRDGLPATVRRPNGLQAFLDAPSPSHHQFLKTSGSMPGQETRGPCSRILEWVPSCAAAWSDMSRDQPHPFRPTVSVELRGPTTLSLNLNFLIHKMGG